jgi:hypothetical protein
MNDVIRKVFYYMSRKVLRVFMSKNLGFAFLAPLLFGKRQAGMREISLIRVDP